MEFAIQARLIERRGDVVVRDETCLDSATTLSDARRTASEHASAGFTVWIYEVRRDNGSRPTYIGVQTFLPDDATARLTSSRTWPPRPAGSPS